LKGSALHHLSQISLPSHYQIRVDQTVYSFNKSQLVIFSPAAVKHFRKETSAFQISPTPECPSQELVSTFSCLYSLLIDKEFLEIHDQNLKVLIYIAEQLDNFLLILFCKEKIPQESILFSFSIETFEFLPKKTKSYCNDFQITVNNANFSFEKGFACCISEILFLKCKLNSSIQSHEFTIPQNIFSCFMSFFRSCQRKFICL
jgi:hypothetical protein